MIRHLMRRALAFALGIAVTVTPAAAAAPPTSISEPIQCILEPGTYAILNSKGEFVGILIVYPDCRLEVYKAKDLV
jgi:hypothetical protein